MSDVPLDIADGIRQGQGLGLRDAKNVVGQALGRFLANARKSGKFIDQLREGMT
jgi:hypothetical protein